MNDSGRPSLETARYHPRDAAKFAYGKNLPVGKNCLWEKIAGFGCGMVLEYQVRGGMVFE